MKFLFTCLFLYTTAQAYSDSNYTLNPPKGRVEEPKMFGSDVLFVRRENKGSGTVFVKLISQDTEIQDYKDFLLGKVKGAKSVSAIDIAPVEKRSLNGHEFYFTSYKDSSSNDLILSGMIKKNAKSYVFIQYKDNAEAFNEEKDLLLLSLNSFKFN